MATMLHQYGTTSARPSPIDLRTPFRAALDAVMRAARVVNGSAIEAETALEDRALGRAQAREHAAVAGERYHNVV